MNTSSSHIGVKLSVLLSLQLAIQQDYSVVQGYYSPQNIISDILVRVS